MACEPRFPGWVRYSGVGLELAGATGLSPATVSNIVKELSASGVLHTATAMRSGYTSDQLRRRR